MEGHVEQERGFSNGKLVPSLHPCFDQRPVASQVAVTEHLGPAAKATRENGQASARCSRPDDKHERHVVHNIITKSQS